MKKWLLLGGIGVAAVAAALVWFRQEPSSSNAEKEGAAHAAPSLLRPTRSPEAEAKAAEDINALLADNSPQAWGQIASLYPGSSDETKRKVLEHIAALSDLDKVVGYLLATVGEDPVPIAQDAMVTETAQLLKSHWKKPEDFDYARQAMMTQKTEKRRWVLANALIAFAKDVGEDSPFHPQKRRLENNLVDIHSETEDAFIKSSIVDGMNALGGHDTALILAKGTNVSDDELESVKEEKAAVEAALRGTKTQ